MDWKRRYPTASQNELAHAFGVDRSTITAYQREGMPYTKTDKGKENIYSLTHCHYWIVTKRYFREIKKQPPRKDALFFILFSYCSHIDATPYMPYQEWLQNAIEMAKYIDCSENDCLEVVGFLKGINEIN